MIPITINNKKYSIKAIWELTTKEFIELSKIENVTVQTYIAWQCSLSEQDIFFASISPAIEASIGQVPDITQMQPCKEFDLKKEIETIGQRHQIEESNKKDLELLIFTLAVSQARSNNIDDVMNLYNEYLQKEFYKVLPTGFFFFRRFRRGKSFGVSSLFWHRALTRIKKKGNRRVLTS